VFRAFEEVRGRDIPTLATLLWLRSLPERMMGRARARSPVPGYAVTDIVERSGASRAFTIADSGARVVSVSGREIVLRYASRPPARAVEPDSILRAYAAALARSAALRVWRSDSDSATFRIGAGPRAIWIEVAVGGDGSTYAVDIMRPDDLLAAPILETLSMSGFGVLAREANREIVLGAVNRSEGAGGGEAAPRFGDLAAFAAYDPPGVSKIAFNLRIVELGDGTSKVVTETRVLATDAAARRAFGAYWRLIHPGSALIRVMWLRAIRARAEATP
jgi:hypothetical protein